VTSEHEALVRALSSRFDELYGEIDRYKSELAKAESKLEGYGALDVREALSTAFASMQDTVAKQLASLQQKIAEGEHQHRWLQQEVARLRDERDALASSIAALQPTASEMRASAADLFRSIFVDVLSEVRAGVETRLGPSPAAAALTDGGNGAQAEAARPTDIQLVLYAVKSLPQLLAIERRVQSLPGVVTMYAHEFSDGTAGLTLSLDGSTRVDELAATLQQLERPRLQLETLGAGVIELRVVDEAAMA
jgi:hypothetical protein